MCAPVFCTERKSVPCSAKSAFVYLDARALNNSYSKEVRFQFASGRFLRKHLPACTSRVERQAVYLVVAVLVVVVVTLKIIIKGAAVRFRLAGRCLDH